MDVLQVIKEEHRGIRQQLGRLTDDARGRKKAFQGLVDALSVYYYLSQEYLEPELAAAAKIEINGSKQKPAVLKRLKLTAKSLTAGGPALIKNVEALKVEVELLINEEEDRLLPKIRQYIPTQDREELGYVINDVRLGSCPSVLGPSKKVH